MTDRVLSGAEIPQMIAQLQEEKKQLVQQKKDSDLVFTLNPNPILIWDQNLRIIDANEAFITSTGWSREKTLSSGLNDFQYLDRSGEGIAETIRDKKQKVGQATFRFPKGVVTWVRHTIPVLDEHGGISRILSIYNDITAQTLQMTEIKDLQERSDTLVNENPIPILQYDTNFRITYANTAFLDMSGYSREELLRMALSDIRILSMDGTGSKAAIQQKARGKATLLIDFPSGRKILEGYTIPLLDQKGEVYAAFGVYLDVTEQKRQFEEISVLQKRSEAIVADNPYPMIIWSPDLRVEMMNRAALNLMGFKETDIRTLTLKDFVYLKQSGQSVADTIRTKEPSKGEATIRFPAGDKIVERYNIPLVDEEGNVSSVLTVYYDITYQKRAIDDIIAVSRAAEAGNLTARTNEEQYTGDYYEISRGINQILDSVVTPFRVIRGQLDELSALSEEVNSSIREVASGTNKIAESTSIVGKNAEQGEDGVGQVLNAMEDLNRTVSDIAMRSESVARLASDADDKSKTGVALAQKAEEVMAGISTNSQEVEEIVRDIKAQMDQIGKIVNVITDIANQTNLLALNAAIEAARAGDAGRGFAVVAAEVKSLAQDSRKSAENIAEMIRQLQEKSGRASEAVNNATTIVKDGDVALAETVEAFRVIADSIGNISTNVTGVAATSEEQAASVQEITASISELSGLLQATAGQAVDSAAATEQASASVMQIERAIGEVSASIEKVAREIARFSV